MQKNKKSIGTTVAGKFKNIVKITSVIAKYVYNLFKSANI